MALRWLARSGLAQWFWAGARVVDVGRGTWVTEGWVLHDVLEPFLAPGDFIGPLRASYDGGPHGFGDYP